MGTYIYGCSDRTEMLDKISWDEDIFEVVMKYVNGRDYFCLSTNEIQSLIDDLIELGDKSKYLCEQLNDLMRRNLDDEWFVFHIG